MGCKEISFKEQLSDSYRQRVDESDKRWLDDDIKDIFEKIVAYLKTIRIPLIRISVLGVTDSCGTLFWASRSLQLLSLLPAPLKLSF